MLLPGIYIKYLSSKSTTFTSKIRILTKLASDVFLMPMSYPSLIIFFIPVSGKVSQGKIKRMSRGNAPLRKEMASGEEVTDLTDSMEWEKVDFL